MNINKLLVAKDGKDAKKETDPDNFKFHSDYNTLKYYLSGHYQMNLPVFAGFTITTQTIPHNLGFSPFFIAFCNDVNAQPTLYTLGEYFSNLGRFVAARAYVDATNLYLVVAVDGGPALTIEWYYKIFRNNLNL